MPLTRRICIAILGSIFFLLGSLISAQELDYSFRHLSEEEGLILNQFNNFIFRDSREFAWISSMQGVYRFDGLEFKHYGEAEIPNFNLEIQSNFFEAENGDLWFTSYEGIIQYIRQNDTFITYQLTLRDSLLDYGYQVFYLDTIEQELWLKARNCLVVFDIENKKIKYEECPKTEGRSFEVIKKGDTVEKIYAFPWNSGDYGVEVWTKTNGNNAGFGYNKHTILSGLNVRSGAIINDSIAWFATSNELIEYDLLREEQIEPIRNNKPPKTDKLFKVLQYSEGTLLVASNTGGWEFDFRNGDFTKNKRVLSFPNEFRYASIINLNIDHYGKLWSSTINQGLMISSPLKYPFDNPLEPEGDVFVRQIIEDSEKRIWVSTQNRGIFVFNQDQIQLNHFDYRNVPGLSEKVNISKSKDGRVWIASDSVIFKSSQSNLTAEIEVDSISAIPNSSSLVSVFDEMNGYTFLITDNGVLHLDEKKKPLEIKPVYIFEQYKGFVFDFFHKLNDSCAILSYNSLDIWILEKGENRKLAIKKLNLKGDVNGVERLEKDTFIIATDKGTFKLHHNDHNSWGILEPNNNGSNGIVKTKNGTWTFPNTGLNYYDEFQNETYNFKVADGLSGSIFSPNSILKSSSNDLWFGNNKGLTVFDPNAVKVEVPAINVFSEYYRINNSVNKIFMAEEDSLDFNFNQNTLTFDLIAVDESLSPNNIIKSRLKHFNENWELTKSGSSIRYINVPPGAYWLELVPINRNNVEGETKRVFIRVYPHWTQTLWFKLFLFLATCFLIGLIIRVYYDRKLKAERRLLAEQKMINDERDRIGKEMHDDMGGGLSSILFISEDLFWEERNTSKREQIQRISELTKISLENMKDIIWALDTEQNSTIDLIFRIQNYATKFLLDHNIEFEYNRGVFINSKILRSEEKRNIFLIIKESLHNIAKHAEATKVSININQENKNYVFLIEDNGKGFDVEQVSGNGHGLENLKYRCEKINGELSLESNLNVGTRMKLIFPID